MGKKQKDTVSLDEIEDLDDSDKSPITLDELEEDLKKSSGVDPKSISIETKLYDDSFIEEITPALTEGEKEVNSRILEEELEALAEGSNIPGAVPGVVDKIFTFEEEEDPAWAKFDDSSIKASIDAGEILPELKPRKNAIYHAILNSLLKEVKSPKGDFYTVEIEIDGMRKSLKANRSFNFSLKRYKVKNNLKFSDLVGREIVFQKDENGYMIVQFK